MENAEGKAPAEGAENQLPEGIGTSRTPVCLASMHNLLWWWDVK